MFTNANVNRDTPPYGTPRADYCNSTVCDVLSYLKVPQNFLCATVVRPDLRFIVSLYIEWCILREN